MTKTVTGLLLLLNMSLQAQTIHVPLQADRWEAPPGIIQFTTIRSVPAMQIIGKGQVVLKDLDFKDGTIEFDIDLVDKDFAQLFFRRASKDDCEVFYFRSTRAGDNDAVDAIQYAPFIKGVNMWDMFYEYQRNATYAIGQWNHVKLVIAGKQMRVYVNNNPNMVLEVAELESNSTHGGLAFTGGCAIANLTVNPKQTEGLSPLPGLDLTRNDPRYLCKWLISPSIDVSGKIDYSDTLRPTPTTPWDTIRAERKGLINISRKYGMTERGKRNFTWLKTNIKSAATQNKTIRMGISDEIWVYLNGRMVYLDKNPYSDPMMKQPDGRISVDNSSFNLPLQKGDNELLVGVANNFYGWGIIARLDDLKEITLER